MGNALQQYSGKGTTNIQDTNTPYLKIAQSISDEVNKQKPTFMPGLEAGQFFCSVTKKIYGSTIQVVVLATRKFYMIVTDDNEFKGSSPVIKPDWTRDVQGTLRTPEGYKVNVNYEYAVIPVADLKENPKVALENPLVFSLKRSDIAAAKDWNTRLKQLCLDEKGELPAPIFGGVWTLTSTYREGDKGSWYGVSTGRAGAISYDGLLDKFVDDDTVNLIASKSEDVLSLAAQAGLLEGSAIRATLSPAAIEQDF